MDLVTWSDAMDASTKTAYYGAFLLESNPGAFVDQILAYARLVLDDALPWPAIRDAVRADGSALLAAAGRSVVPPAMATWKALVTYREGLLCSACEPNFARFLHVSEGEPRAATLKLQPGAADEVASRFTDALGALDGFLSEAGTTELIGAVVEKACLAAGHSDGLCSTLPGTVSLVVNGVRSGLRAAVCGPAAAHHELDPDAVCHGVIVGSVLRGLVVDPQPLADNVGAWLQSKCGLLPKPYSSECATLDQLPELIRRMSFSFDARPIPTNAYVTEPAAGFDVKARACSSNLSGFACGGHGPRAQSHGDVSSATEDADAPAPEQSRGMSGGAIAAVVFVSLGVAVVAVVGFVWRARIRDAVHDAYERIRERGAGGAGDAATRPLVGFV